MNVMLKLFLKFGYAATLRSNDICNKHAFIKMFCNYNFKKHKNIDLI